MEKTKAKMPLGLVVICHLLLASFLVFSGIESRVLPLGESCDQDGYYANGGYCNSFIECINGFAQVRKCPEGLVWNAAEEICDTSNPSLCMYVPICERDGQFFPNPNNCSTYYICSNGIIYLMACPTGLVWNYTASVCSYPTETMCAEF